MANGSTLSPLDALALRAAAADQAHARPLPRLAPVAGPARFRVT
jgi:hypothetical protein